VYHHLPIVKHIILVAVLIELEMLVYNCKQHVEVIHLLLLVVFRHQLQHIVFQLLLLIPHVRLLQLLLLVKLFILALEIIAMQIVTDLRLVALLI
jgi:hypothetical protein